MQLLDYNNGNWVFLRGPCRDVKSKGQRQLKVSSLREPTKRRLEPKAEELPLLEQIKETSSNRLRTLNCVL
jgi:hypothetical protein